MQYAPTPFAINSLIKLYFYPKHIDIKELNAYNEYMNSYSYIVGRKIWKKN